MKAHQIDPDSLHQRDQGHHHLPKKLPHRQGDHALNKEVDRSKDEKDPHHQVPDHQPDNWKLN